MRRRPRASATPVPLVEGTLLKGKYELKKRIGRGGMSNVWLATNRDRNPRSTDSRVAVKILKPELAEDRNYVQRFEREAETMERLSHPNIVEVYDSDEDQGQHFLVMEYLKGRSGAALIQEKAQIEPSVAAMIVAQVCEGLQCVHENGVVHRDIKPANIMVAGRLGAKAKPTVKLTDFGIARGDDDTTLTLSMHVVGTLPYLAPECLIEGKRATKASDLYSAGVILYELLTGSRPHDGEPAGAFASQPTPPDRRSAGVPPSLSQATMCALSYDPRDRFPDAATMHRAIVDGAAGKDISSLLPTRLQRQQKPKTGVTEVKPGVFGRAEQLRRRREQLKTDEPPIDWGDIVKAILTVAIGMIAIVACIRSIAFLSELPDPALVALVLLCGVAILVAHSPSGRKQVASVAGTAWLAVRPLGGSELATLGEQQAARAELRLAARRLARLVLVGGLIAYWAGLTFQLAAAMEREIGRLPSGERLPFEIATLTIWLLAGVLPVAKVALSRSRLPRLLLGVVLLIVGWTAGAALLPDAPGKIAPLIWPDTRLEAIEQRVSVEAGDWSALLRQPYARRAIGPPPWQVMDAVREAAHKRLRDLRRAAGRTELTRAKRHARSWVARMRRNRRRWHSARCRGRPGHVRVTPNSWGTIVVCG